jgi:hypothetical protein
MFTLTPRACLPLRCAGGSEDDNTPVLDWSLVWVATPNGGEAFHDTVLHKANEAYSRREVEADHTSRAYFRWVWRESSVCVGCVCVCEWRGGWRGGWGVGGVVVVGSV